MCSQIEVLLKENYFEKSFLINASFISQSNSFSLRSLINSDFIVYMLIHDQLVDKVCQKLEIQFILLAKKKLIWNYDEKLARKTITHKILLNLTIKSHKKLTMLMLIADIEHHEAILSKFWMNKNKILLNIRHDTIVFSDQLNISISVFLISSNMKHLSWSWSTSISSAALDWLHQVEYLSLSRVFDSSRLDLSQNSWLEYLSWVRRFDSSIQVESEN